MDDVLRTRRRPGSHRSLRRGTGVEDAAPHVAAVLGDCESGDLESRCAMVAWMSASMSRSS